MIVSELSSQEAILTMVMMVILFLVLMTIEQSATSARYLYTHNMSWHFMREFLVQMLQSQRNLKIFLQSRKRLGLNLEMYVILMVKAQE